MLNRTQLLSTINSFSFTWLKRQQKLTNQTKMVILLPQNSQSEVLIDLQVKSQELSVLDHTLKTFQKS